MKLLPFLALATLFLFDQCIEPQAKTDTPKQTEPAPPATITPHEQAWYQTVGDIPVPEGYTRLSAEENSFGKYLRSLPLKQGDNTVYLYNGEQKYNQNAHFAVVKMNVGTKDLQQCADAVMRLRAEHLYHQKQYEDIHFNFTSGDRADYDKYAKGYRPKINGNEVNWTKRSAEDYSYATFTKYMDLVFNYAGTYSLEQELSEVADYNLIQAGYVFILGGFPGHAIIVVDVAENKETGKRIFMLAQSYMPAQEIHILKNPNNDIISPWYNTNSGERLETPEWDFTETQLKSF